MHDLPWREEFDGAFCMGSEFLTMGQNHEGPRSGWGIDQGDFVKEEQLAEARLQLRLVTGEEVDRHLLTSRHRPWLW